MGNNENWEGMKRSRKTAAELNANNQEPGLNPDPSKFVWIPPGQFTMGTPEKDADKDSDEQKQTVVTLTRGFWMSKHPTTQEEYQAVSGANPSYFSDNARRPVEQVSWNDANEYCAKLTVILRDEERLPANYVCRLPTEAEWEYACRAGSKSRFGFGDDYEQLAEYAWYIGNSGKTTQPVEGKAPNSWGLHDMHGNVWEWCLDWYSDTLPGGSVTDPKGPAEGMRRVSRGGGWMNIGWYCRSATRFYVWTVGKMNALGFRPVIGFQK